MSAKVEIHTYNFSTIKHKDLETVFVCRTKAFGRFVSVVYLLERGERKIPFNIQKQVVNMWYIFIRSYCL